MKHDQDKSKLGEVITYRMSSEEFEARYGVWGDAKMAARVKTRHIAGTEAGRRDLQRQQKKRR